MAKQVRARVSRDDWLKAALEMLSSEGVEAVKIDRLARQVGVAKTGFYWHFKNRRDLLDAMLEFWEREFTAVISENPLIRGLPPAERLQAINETVDTYHLNQYDLAIAAWARTDDKARQLLDKTYSERRSFVGQAFRELGFKGDDLEMRTRLFVCYVSSAPQMFGERMSARDKRLRTLRNRLLIQQLTGK